MKIVKDSKFITELAEIKKGDVFKIGDEFYLKCERNGESFHVVNLITGDMDIFHSSYTVTRLPNAAFVENF